jgi:hypothetical protein
VHHGKYNDLVADRTEVDGIREAVDEPARCLAMDAGMGQGILEDRSDRCVDRGGEDIAQSNALPFVPDSRIE